MASRLFVPPTCSGCGQRVAAAALCPACWKKLHFISKPFCHKYAVPFAYEAAPDTLSPEALRFPPPWNEARAAVLFKDLAADLVHGLKYGDRHDYAPLMAQMMLRAGGDLVGKADYICPVPLHWRRMIRRHYNQAGLLAKRIARSEKKAVAPRFLVRRKATATQVGLSREGRARNLQNAFMVREKNSLQGSNILLVDDVMTSGATLSAATRALLKAGAVEVNVLVFARVTDVIE
ncbi:MAG: ComF family protein [Pseudomonadota bacterium]